MDSKRHHASMRAQSTVGLPSRELGSRCLRPHVPDYRLIKPISQGSFGTVWLAVETLVGAFRAIKVLDGGASQIDGRGAPGPGDEATYSLECRPSSDEVSERGKASKIDRELAGLNAYQRVREHAHLIRIFKTGLCRLASDRDASVPLPLDGPTFVYYVMEIADHAGGSQPHRPEDYYPLTLGTYVRQRGRLAPSSSHIEDRKTETIQSQGSNLSEYVASLNLGGVIEIALCLVDAIDHLHKSGIQHRDIKPSNVLFVGGIVKLADIGLTSTELEERVGTFDYTTPEGKASDIYALGKVMYEMLTGLEARDFPEWPGDLGPASWELGRHSQADVRLSRLRDIINRLCHPVPQSRSTKLSELRRELISLVRPARPRALRNSGMLIASILFGLAIGTMVGRTWLKVGDQYERWVGGPPYDGSEFAHSFEFQGRKLRLQRSHSPGKTLTLVDNGTVARFWDLETRIHEGRFEIRGSFQVFNERNPLIGDITTPGGEINQVYLLLGAHRVILYHGQQGPEPGTMSVFGRGIPLDRFISAGKPVHLNIRLRIGTDSAPGAVEESVTEDVLNASCLEVALIHENGDPRHFPVPADAQSASPPVRP